MKKVLFALITLAMLFAMILPCFAAAEGELSAPLATDANLPAIADVPAAAPTDPFSWEYLVTIAGAAAFTLLVAQFLKFPLDKVWKVPTRIVVYVIALAVMLIATAFTTGLTAQNALLAFVNAFVAALTAMGGYEITFAKMGK